MTDLDNKSHSIAGQKEKLKPQTIQMIKTNTQALGAKRVSFMDY